MPAWLTAPNLAPAPLAAAVAAVVALVAYGVGWTVWRMLGWARSDGGPALLAAGGLGFVLLGYAILALGLLGLLSPLTLAGVVGLFLLAGAASLQRVLKRLREAVSKTGRAVAWSPNRAIYCVALAWLTMTFLGALGPADARDWDGLSEHLAQAKTYLRDGRVHPLWYDHHSQFPATMVMLYSLGLALGGQGAAKLFHWTFALMSLLAVRHLARRHLTPSAGGPALAVLATTPLVGWLATVGYVDLSSVFFSLVTANYLLSWREKGRSEDLLRAGLMAGAGMTVKMQGLFTFGIFLLALLLWAWRLGRGLRPVLVYVAVAGALASPWYIKTWVITGNPVYPFAWGLFGGKQWSAEQARPYAYHHAGFGYGKLPSEREWQQLSPAAKHLTGPRNPLNLVLTPFTLTLFPEYYAPRQPRFTAMVMLSIGPLWLMLLPLLALIRRRKPPAVGWLLGIFAGFYLLWFETTQLERYLLPWLALLAPPAGLAVAWLWKGPRPASAVFKTLVALWMAVALLFLALQVGPVLPVVLGMENPQTYLTGDLDCYEPLVYVNRNTSADALIATYGEPRLFYLDRDHLWADPGHSQLINYKAATTPEKLISEYRRLGIDYVLINQQFFGPLGSGRSKLHKLLARAIEEGWLVPMPLPSAKFLLLKVSDQ